jgi:predicted amidophosphoribosyltransferase
MPDRFDFEGTCSTCGSPSSETNRWNLCRTCAEEETEALEEAREGGAEDLEDQLEHALDRAWWQG